MRSYGGIERLEGLSVILDQTKTHCWAFALIPNHFHLLLRTGRDPLAQVMRRLLTAYVKQLKSPV